MEEIGDATALQQTLKRRAFNYIEVIFAGDGGAGYDRP
jgi:hypothetical protein